MIRREVNNQISDIDEKILDELNKLPENFWDFKEADTTEMVHGIHTYPAMMIYPISRNILNIVKKYKNFESILDPFSGSFTTSAVAVRLGRVGIGIDMNEEYYEMGLRRTGIAFERKGKSLEKVKARKTNAKSKYVRGE